MQKEITIVQPCKIGDAIYIVKPKNESVYWNIANNEYTIKEDIVHTLEYRLTPTMIYWAIFPKESYDIYIDKDINTKIFFDKQEAEYYIDNLTNKMKIKKIGH